MAFARAVHHVNTAEDMGLVGDADKLSLYALYKQATVGDVQGERPAFIYFESRAKHDAWTKIKGISKEQAKTMYVTLLARLDPRFKG